MQAQLTKELSRLLDFDQITNVETIQSLWSGYGLLLRVSLHGSKHESVIVKRIAPPAISNHPRGWNSDIGHQRKLQSYEVEAAWYRLYNDQCGTDCRTATMLGCYQRDDHSLLVLEDLDSAGFFLRKNQLSVDELKQCLAWLATFHARFMNVYATGLWDIGTYWQLDTRTEEYDTMADSALKVHARAIHERLNSTPFQTLVHGDAKPANFCFSPDGAVAAVDFQYVGSGCGMKDVTYLLSCMPGGIANEKQESTLLEHYFSVLRKTLRQVHPSLASNVLEHEWRQLYPIAWADFERFLLGWAPGHWKSTDYSAQQVKKALERIASL